MDSTDSSRQINQVQSLWHDVFGGDEVPGDEATVELMRLAGSYQMISEALIICQEKSIVGYRFQYAYVCGIIRNKKMNSPKKWTGK